MKSDHYDMCRNFDVPVLFVVDVPWSKLCGEKNCRSDCVELTGTRKHVGGSPCVYLDRLLSADGERSGAGQ